MSCLHCKQALEIAIAQLAGVKSVQIDLDSGLGINENIQQNIEELR